MPKIQVKVLSKGMSESDTSILYLYKNHVVIHISKSSEKLKRYQKKFTFITGYVSLNNLICIHKIDSLEEMDFIGIKQIYTHSFPMATYTLQTNFSTFTICAAKNKLKVKYTISL